jgi:hypothetical protein
MFGSPETDKAPDFIALSDDALEEASGGGLPLFNAHGAPGLITYYTIQLVPEPFHSLQKRDHSACDPCDGALCGAS